jgi:hypothetical protein
VTIMKGNDAFEAGRRSVPLSREAILDPIRQLKPVISATVDSSWHKVKSSWIRHATNIPFLQREASQP